MAATTEQKRGGWFKVYSEFRKDPKVIHLDDLAFRLFFVALAFANDSPWDLRRRGFLYHNVEFPVSSLDFQGAVPKHSLEDVETSLGVLCSLGGQKHSLILWDGKRKAWRIRNWRKWQDGLARDFAAGPPENHQVSTEKPPENHPPKTLDVRRKTLHNNTAAKKPPRPGCEFCHWRSSHDGDSIPDGKRFRNQRFHDRACEVLQQPCYPMTKKVQSLLAKGAREDGEDRLFEWWDEFLRKPCDIGHTVEVFNSRRQQFRELDAKRNDNPRMSDDDESA